MKVIRESDVPNHAERGRMALQSALPTSITPSRARSPLSPRSTTSLGSDRPTQVNMSAKGTATLSLSVLQVLGHRPANPRTLSDSDRRQQEEQLKRSATRLPRETVNVQQEDVMEGKIAIFGDDVRRAVLEQEHSYTKVQFGQEIRKASLYSEFTIGGKTISFDAVAGARSCSTTSLGLDRSRSTLVYSLQCDLTYFHAPDSEVGPITIIDDPRRPILGKILLRRTEDGSFQLPALSYFNQYLVFNIGKYFFYYPSPWQVVSSITAWPPEFHQYHHLQDDTPVYDFNTREPNVARKGISTISILGKLTPAEEKSIREAHAKQVALIKRQPGFKVAPEDFLTTPGKKG